MPGPKPKPKPKPEIKPGPKKRPPLQSVSLEEKDPFAKMDDPPFWSIYKDGITQSLMNLFMACPEKAKLKMKEGLEPTRSSGKALQFGDIFHKALDHVYSNKDFPLNQRLHPNAIGKMVDAALKVIETEETQKLKDNLRPSDEINELADCIALNRVMLLGYFMFWKKDFQDLNWVDLEREFSVSYMVDGREIPIRGKYDGVFLDKKGKHWLFETKTKSRVDDALISDTIPFNLQVMLYLWTMREVYGGSPQGVMYNVVQKPLLRQGKTESKSDFIKRVTKDVIDRPEYYFKRYEVTVLPMEINKWAARDLSGIIRQLHDWYKGDFNYRNSGNCQAYNRPCEFLAVCSREDRSFVQKRDVVFRELSGEAE